MTSIAFALLKSRAFPIIAMVLLAAHSLHLHLPLFAQGKIPTTTYIQPGYMGSNPVVDKYGKSAPPETKDGEVVKEPGQYSKQELGQNTAGLPVNAPVVVPNY